MRLCIHGTEKGRATAVGDLLRQRLSAWHIPPRDLPLEVPVDDVEDYGGNSLGSAELLVKGRALSFEPAALELTSYRDQGAAFEPGE
jgi:hypothetical protein